MNVLSISWDNNDDIEAGVPLRIFRRGADSPDEGAKNMVFRVV